MDKNKKIHENEKLNTFNLEQLKVFNAYHHSTNHKPNAPC
jgi:hypothetical protein